MSLNCSEVQEFIGWRRTQAVLKPFLPSSSLCQRRLPDLTVHYKVPANFIFNFSIRSSKFTAPSISRGSDASFRSVLVMNFDTSKRLWSNGCGSMSIHCLSRIGTLIDEFTTDLGFGSALVTSFPVLMNCSTFSTGISLDVSVTYLLIPFTMRTHETVRSLNNSIMILMQKTSFVRIEFRIQDWAELRIWQSPPSRWGCCEVSRLSPLLVKSPLPKRLVAWSRGCRHSAKLIIMISPTLFHSPFGLLTWVPYHFLSQSSPKYDQPPNGNHLAYVATFKNSPHNFLHSMEFHHTMSLYINMKMILPLSCSGFTQKNLPLSFESQWDSQRSAFWEIIPLEFHQFSVNSIQFFEIACFQIPFDYVFPSLNWFRTGASQT